MQAEHVVEEKLKEKNKLVHILLIVVCTLAFLVVQGSKNMYVAEMVYLAEIFNESDVNISLTTTLYFITYAAVQVLLFFIMKKINVRLYLIATLCLSSVLTFLVGFASTVAHFWVIYSINGILQAGTYAGSIALFAKYLPKRTLSFANKVFSFGAALAGVISYGLPALFISRGLWHAPFKIMGVVMLAVVVALFFVTAKLVRGEVAEKGCAEADNSTNNEKEKTEEERPFINLSTKKNTVIFYAVMLTMSLLANCVYYAMYNWTTKLLFDVFGLSHEYSMLFTMVIPIILAIGPMITISLCDKFKDFVGVASVIRILLLPLILFLVFLYDFNMILSFVVVLLCLLMNNGSMIIFTTVTSLKMRKSIDSGGYVAVMNAIASIGAGVAPTIMANFINNLGWSTAYLICFIVFAVLTALNVVYDIILKKQNA